MTKPKAQRAEAGMRLSGDGTFIPAAGKITLPPLPSLMEPLYIIEVQDDPKPRKPPPAPSEAP
jgi:hypothetical protein